MAKKKKSRSRIGKLSRTKGKVFERVVAADLRAIYGEQVKRGWQAREGTDAPDVENVPFWVECKHHQRVNIQAAVKQARADVKKAGRELPILVVAMDNRSPPLAVVDWQQFLELLKQIEGAKRSRMLVAEQVPKVEVEVFKMAQPHQRADPLEVARGFAELGAPSGERERFAVPTRGTETPDRNDPELELGDPLE